MDARLPFARGADRVQLLYRLPLSGTETSFLTIAHTTDGDPPAPQGLVVCRLTPQQAAAFGERFDVVLLPGTLTHAPTPHAPLPAREITRLAFDRLKPGGRLIGHLDHVLAPRQLGRWLSAGIGLRRALAWRGFETPGRSLASLQAAGFMDPECYFVEPHMDDPMALVSSIPAAARTHFLRTIRRNRMLHSPPGHWARLALARCGVAGLLQPHLFFWARKPC